MAASCPYTTLPVKSGELTVKNVWLHPGQLNAPCFIYLFIWEMAQLRYRQDLPPKGGYPGISWQRNLPKRGYSGMTLFVAATGIITGGFVVLIRHIRRQRFENCKFAFISIHKPTVSCTVLLNLLLVLLLL